MDTQCPMGYLSAVTLKKTIERDEIANALRLQRISSSIIRVKKPVLRAIKQMQRAIERHNADYLIGLAAQRPFRHGLSSMRPLKRNTTVVRSSKLFVLFAKIVR